MDLGAGGKQAGRKPASFPSMLKSSMESLSTDWLSGHSGHRAEPGAAGRGNRRTHSQCEQHQALVCLAPSLIVCFSSCPSVDFS